MSSMQLVRCGPGGPGSFKVRGARHRLRAPGPRHHAAVCRHRIPKSKVSSVVTRESQCVVTRDRASQDDSPTHFGPFKLFSYSHIDSYLLILFGPIILSLPLLVRALFTRGS